MFRTGASRRAARHRALERKVSAAHSREDLEFAVNAFAEVNEELK